MKKIGIFVFLLIFPTAIATAAYIAEKLQGKILLQVEQNGEALYINPSDQKR